MAPRAGWGLGAGCKAEATGPPSVLYLSHASLCSSRAFLKYGQSSAWWSPSHLSHGPPFFLAGGSLGLAREQ